MKDFKILLLTIITLLIALLSGCGPKLQSEYIPSRLLPYANKLNLTIAITEIKDERPYEDWRDLKVFKAIKYYEEDMFYYNAVDPYWSARYDRPISNIVKDALNDEFKCIGMKVFDNANGNTKLDLLLECSITNFETFCDKIDTGEGIIKAIVTIDFKWKDAESQRLVNTSRQSDESIIIRTESNSKYFEEDFSTDEENKKVIMGKKLIKELLPKVIEKELTTNSFLKKRAGVE